RRRAAAASPPAPRRRRRADLADVRLRRPPAPRRAAGDPAAPAVPADLDVPRTRAARIPARGRPRAPLSADLRRPLLRPRRRHGQADLALRLRPLRLGLTGARARRPVPDVPQPLTELRRGHQLARWRARRLR